MNWLYQRKEKIISLSILGACFALALLIRWNLLNFVNSDTVFFSDQYEFIKLHGGFLSLKYNLEFYQPLYYYLLTTITYFPIQKFHAVKLIPVFFDFFLAFFAYKLVRHKYGKLSSLPLAAFFIILFTPTVFMTSALWGQFDVIYTVFLLASSYFLLSRKYFLTFLMFGLSISIKPLGFFFIPVLLLMWAKNKYPLWYFLLIPLTYFVTIIPSILLGRSITNLLFVPFTSSEFFKQLTLNAPTLYQIFPTIISNQNLALITEAGAISAIGVMILFVFLIHKNIKVIKDEMLLLIITAFSVIVPFILPRMHERYFFPATIFSILLAFYKPRLFYIPLIIQFTVLLTYVPFLFFFRAIDFIWPTIAMFAIVVLLIREIILSR